MAFDRITVNPEQMGGVPCIRGLRIIMQNLITNAVKYTNTKVTISISIQKGVVVSQIDRKDSNGVLVKVSDDGIGFTTGWGH